MIDYLMLKDSKEVYIIKVVYDKEMGKPLADSLVDQFERLGYGVTYVDHLKIMADGSYMRVGYKLGNVEFGFITNEPIFVRLSPKVLAEED